MGTNDPFCATILPISVNVQRIPTTGMRSPLAFCQRLDLSTHIILSLYKPFQSEPKQAVLTLLIMLILRTTSLLLVLLVGSFTTAAPVVRNVQEDLAYDENGKLRKHTLLYNAACQDKPYYISGLNYPLAHFDVVLTTDERLFAKNNDDDDDNNNNDATHHSHHDPCQAVCLERGVDQSVAHAVMPHKRYHDRQNDTPDSPHAAFHHWFEQNCVRVEVCFLNYHSPHIVSYWIHPVTGQRQEHLTVDFGERQTKCFDSYIGHEFEIVDQTADDQPLLARVTVQHLSSMAFGTAPPSGVLRGGNVADKVKRTLDNEWHRHQVVTRTFSPLGFQKGRLPDDIFAHMGAFYYNNRHHKVLEEWGGKGVFVNWWESNVNFIQIPWKTKMLWQGRLLDMVQHWAGVPIEETVMYGLRQYEDGARLLTHVDRERTHAVSLIVNVAQGNLTHDWPVEVFDHADRLHEVVMAPGDVVYYESAKCLHSRNQPLRGNEHGGYYVNLFTHYRPIGDDDWLSRDNPPGTPEPVLETQGECRTVTSETTNKEYVECDDPRLGPYLSPSLFVAHNGGDLFEWWRRTSPEVLGAVPSASSASKPPSTPTTSDAESVSSGSDEL